MENTVEIQRFQKISDAQGFLRKKFEGEINKVIGEVEEKDREGFNHFISQATDSISGMVKIPRLVTEEELWNLFLTNVYEKSEYHRNLISKIENDIEKQLSEAEQSQDIVRLSNKQSYISKGGVLTDLKVSGKLIVSKGEVNEMIDSLFDNSNEDEIELTDLLNFARKYVETEKPQKSFVLLKKSGENRYGFGVEIDDDGNLVQAGLSEIRHACREYTFDTVIDNLQETEGGIKILPISHKFEDYPGYLSNPYLLSRDLFMLRSTSGHSWVNIHLENTKVGEEIRRVLPRNINLIH